MLPNSGTDANVKVLGNGRPEIEVRERSMRRQAPPDGEGTLNSNVIVTARVHGQAEKLS